MKKEITKVLAIIVIFFFLAWTFNLQVSRASTTLIVPDNYPTITSAINHASAGDIIVVKSGMYNENLQINKSITLEGENNNNTVIIGSASTQRASSAALTIAADNVKVSGFTIQSLPYSNSSIHVYGIFVEGDNATITNNIIQQTYLGIFCSIQSYTTINNNTVTSNLKDGIRFFGGSLNTVSDNIINANGQSGISMDGYSNVISGNIVQNNYRGIGSGSTYSVIFNNTLMSNQESGLFFAGSHDVISANTFSGNKWGVYVSPQLFAPQANRFYHNNFENNINNVYDNSSSPLQYWDNGPQSGGNYWSDYLTRYPAASESSVTGIGNTPYVVYANFSDNYPLMAPFTPSAADMPSTKTPPAANPNSIVASWSFDTVDSNLVTPDSTGNNPAILGSAVANYSYTPMLVTGKFQEALSFNGNMFASVYPSPSLETSGDVTVDAWVYVPSIKAVAYNNILIECVRTTASLPTRTLGLAINGATPQNGSSIPTGALRGYVTTQNGSLNEIDTLNAVPLNQWIHVVFTRSVTDGMHIFVNGKEQQVQVVAGVADPKGAVARPTDIYIGHDSFTTIDELHISNMVEPQTQPLWMQWWLWAVLIVAVSSIGMIFYFKRVLKT